MRCRGCDKMLSGNSVSVNKHTGVEEDICTACRSPIWDLGVEYHAKEDGSTFTTDAVKKFYNEADFIKDFVGGDCGLSDELSIIQHIKDNGNIKTEE